jgi:hypothetical protein
MSELLPPEPFGVRTPPFGVPLLHAGGANKSGTGTEPGGCVHPLFDPSGRATRLPHG